MLRTRSVFASRRVVCKGKVTALIPILNEYVFRTNYVTVCINPCIAVAVVAAPVAFRNQPTVTIGGRHEINVAISHHIEVGETNSCLRASLAVIGFRAVNVFDVVVGKVPFFIIVVIVGRIAAKVPKIGLAVYYVNVIVIRFKAFRELICFLCSFCLCNYVFVYACIRTVCNELKFAVNLHVVKGVNTVLTKRLARIVYGNEISKLRAEGKESTRFIRREGYRVVTKRLRYVFNRRLNICNFAVRKLCHIKNLHRFELFSALIDHRLIINRFLYHFAKHLVEEIGNLHVAHFRDRRFDVECFGSFVCRHRLHASLNTLTGHTTVAASVAANRAAAHVTHHAGIFVDKGIYRINIDTPCCKLGLNVRFKLGNRLINGSYKEALRCRKRTFAEHEVEKLINRVVLNRIVHFKRAVCIQREHIAVFRFGLGETIFNDRFQDVVHTAVFACAKARKQTADFCNVAAHHLNKRREFIFFHIEHIRLRNNHILFVSSAHCFRCLCVCVNHTVTEYEFHNAGSVIRGRGFARFFVRHDHGTLAFAYDTRFVESDLYLCKGHFIGYVLLVTVRIGIHHFDVQAAYFKIIGFYQRKAFYHIPVEVIGRRIGVLTSTNAASAVRIGVALCVRFAVGVGRITYRTGMRRITVCRTGRCGYAIFILMRNLCRVIGNVFVVTERTGIYGIAHFRTGSRNDRRRIVMRKCGREVRAGLNLLTNKTGLYRVALLITCRINHRRFIGMPVCCTAFCRRQTDNRIIREMVGGEGSKALAVYLGIGSRHCRYFTLIVYVINADLIGVHTVFKRIRNGYGKLAVEILNRAACVRHIEVVYRVIAKLVCRFVINNSRNVRFFNRKINVCAAELILNSLVHLNRCVLKLYLACILNCRGRNGSRGLRLCREYSLGFCTTDVLTAIARQAVIRTANLPIMRIGIDCDFFGNSFAAIITFNHFCTDCRTSSCHSGNMRVCMFLVFAYNNHNRLAARLTFCCFNTLIGARRNLHFFRRPRAAIGVVTGRARRDVTIAVAAAFTGIRRHTVRCTGRCYNRFLIVVIARLRYVRLLGRTANRTGVQRVAVRKTSRFDNRRVVLVSACDFFRLRFATLRTGVQHATVRCTGCRRLHCAFIPYVRTSRRRRVFFTAGTFLVVLTCRKAEHQRRAKRHTRKGNECFFEPFLH